MQAKVFAKPQYELTLTEDEANCLIECARHHYDFTCKASVRPGPDGFLNMLNHQLNDPGRESTEYYVSVDFRKLDLLSKITEDYTSNVDPTKRHIFDSIQELMKSTNSAPEFTDYVMAISFLPKRPQI